MKKLKKIIILTAICIMQLTLPGCAEKEDNFVDFDKFDLSEPDEPEIAENIEITTEFSEYDGDVDEIVLSITNNSDEDFGYGKYYILQKLDEGEWKYIWVFGKFTLLAYICPPFFTATPTIELKDHIEQPLLPGRYRIGIGDIELDYSINGKLAYAEFTIK